MHKLFVTLTMTIALLTGLVFFGHSAQAADFTLSSTSISESTPLAEKYVLNGFGCMGNNVSPALSWNNPPQGTQSFALNVYDPDAPTGSGWWHWVVFNIPASATGLDEGAGTDEAKLPTGAMQSRTDFGKPGYGGACPPKGHGDHRYIFTVYALDIPTLDLSADSSPAMVGFFLNAHTIDKASLTTTYGR